MHGLRLRYAGITPNYVLEISDMFISKWIFYGRRRIDWLGDFDFPWEFGRENGKWFCATCAKMDKQRNRQGASSPSRLIRNNMMTRTI